MNKNLNKRNKNATRKNKNFSKNFKKYFKSYVKKYKDQLPEFIQNLTDKQINIIGNNKYKFNYYMNNNNDAIIKHIINYLIEIYYKNHNIDDIISHLNMYDAETLGLYTRNKNMNPRTGTHYNNEF